MWRGYLRRVSRPSARCLRINSSASSDTPCVQSGGRPRSIEASRFPRLQTISPRPMGFSKSYQDHHNKAEWLVLQLKKLPKTWASVEKSSSTSQGCGIRFQPPSYSMCVSVARRPLPTIGGHRSPTVVFVKTPRAVPEEACLPLRYQRCRPLAEPSPFGFPRSIQDSAGRSSPRGSRNCKNRLQRLRSIGVMKMSSSVKANRRLILLCADSVSVLASMQQVLSQRLRDLGLADWDVPFHRGFFSLGLKFFLLLSEFLPIAAVPPSCAGRFSPKSGLPELMTATSRL